MAERQAIQTDAAPSAIGPYSQATRHGDTVYISGQIPLDPETMELVAGDIAAQTRQVFANLRAVASASGGGLDNALKLTIYLTDLGEFATVNAVMAEELSEPFPARATVQVSALPKGAQVEIDAILAV